MIIDGDMNIEKITPAQKRALSALISIYSDKKDFVKSNEISKALGIKASYIRTIMHKLKTYGYVKTLAGNRGGYTPTEKAYKELGIIPKLVKIPVLINSKKLELLVERISFISTDSTYMRIKIFDTCEVQIGDEITVEPTPINKFVLCGKVVGKDDLNLIIKVSKAVALPKYQTKDCMEAIKTVDENASLVEVAKKISEDGSFCIAVVGRKEVHGIVTLEEINKAIAVNKIDVKAKDIANKNFEVVSGDMPLWKAILKMKKHNKEYLIIEGEKIGILTCKRILCFVYE